MKLREITFLLLASTLAVSSCAKKKDDGKATEDTEKENKDGGGKKDKPAAAFEGALIIGKNTRLEELKGLYSGVSADDKALSEKYVTQVTRLKTETVANEGALRLTGTYEAATKKLTIFKSSSSLKVVNVKEGKADSIDVKTITKVPTLKIADKAVELIADEKAKQFSLKADASIDVADITKPIAAKVAADDEKLKIAEASSDLAPAVVLGSAEEQSIELVLDLSKGEVPAGITFVSSYAGAEGDATKPECYLISQEGIGKVKPIEFNTVLDIGQEDHSIDFSKAPKEELAKLPTGETKLEIHCLRSDTSKNPGLVSITMTKGLKLKVIQAEAPKEEKKEEAKK